ncbi:MAG: ATP-grasp domain-containing protein, partial [Burkholderiales bacterium]
MGERVLITGARAPAALDIARSFAAAGFEVHMADCVPSRMAKWSRAVKAVHRYPSPRGDRVGFCDAILKLMEQLNPRLVVPTCEEVFHLAMMNYAPAQLLAPDWTVLRRLHSKAMFAEDC